MARIAVKISQELELSRQMEPYKNFINSLDSEVTKKSYRESLTYFMRFLNVETYEDLLGIEPLKLEGIIRDYIIYMRQDKKSSPATVTVRIAAISHFYEMNDISLRWKKLKKFKAKFRNVIEDRPYTRDQINKLLNAAPLRDKAMILLMASSGMRRGALPHLRLCDMTRIEKYGVLKFNVYKKEQESYITYCTPECAKFIDQYMRWRERLGERFTPNTPLFRLVFDTVTEVNRPKPIQSEAIARRINQLLQDSEVRISTGSKRTEIMETHGFRKFFKTTCINAGMHPLYSEYLMGHRSGLTKSYFKPTDTELLEGNDKALGYTSVINDLTINEEHRLTERVTELQSKNDQIIELEQQHKRDLESVQDHVAQMMRMIRQNPKLAKIKTEVLLNKRARI